MPLPSFTCDGEFPPGVHRATLNETLSRLGRSSPERATLGRRLAQIYSLAAATGKVRRFVLFGSFVTAKRVPNDVDLFLVMENDFAASLLDRETAAVFDHQIAQEVLNATIFWLRSLAALDGEQAAVEYWQVTRGGGRRGIVEIVEPGR